MSAADVVILGAGLVGASCAESLSRQKLRVTVIEAGVVGAGATAAGMGHITVMDDSEAQFALTRYSQSLWRARIKELPASVEWQNAGTLWVAADDEEMQAVHTKQAFYTQRGVPVHTLDARAVVEAEPNLRPGLAGGFLVPQDSVIYAPCAAAWLMQRAKAAGAHMRLGVRATRVDGRRVHLDDDTHIDAGSVIVACGHWSRQLLPNVPVRPRKGHLAITDRYPGFVHHQLVELGYLKSAHGHDNESVAFNVQPRATGQLLIGSSRQFDIEHSEVEPRFLARMLARAFEYMPGLQNMSIIRTWTGFRAATPDSLPLIGPHPSHDGLYLATGHEGLGITTSLGTAAILTDHMMHRPPAIPIEPYLPARFANV
ncbi:MAG: FAD-dependent oxidoreductase [Acidobacteria bacterium]|nr:FAD-dependent oxidoreductase [Acidobacteriota bacterium]